METFGRLMAGIAPWLSLPDDDTAEGQQRKQLKEWALKSYANAVDPNSPDYLLWNGHGQALVDAAYIAEVPARVRPAVETAGPDNKGTLHKRVQRSPTH